MTDLELLARDLVLACTRADRDRCRELTAADFAYWESGTCRRVAGIDGLVDGWERWLVAFPDTTVEIVDVAVGADLTVAALIWRATQSGPLDTGAEPSYKRIELWDVVTTRWRDGRAMEERHRIGLLSLFAPMLGIVPAASDA